GSGHDQRRSAGVHQGMNEVHPGMSDAHPGMSDAHPGMTTTEQVGRAMIKVSRDGYAKPVLESEDINRL
ncbi:MAG TPA: hypothetical protein VK577_29345, partial [Bradyrhizobium sp.]|nr:hypothetical protein [Bradyrhizobium sp.]